MLITPNPSHLKRLSDNEALRLETEARVERYGHPPGNIFTELRTREHYSLTALAQAARIDRKALSRAEAGMYTLPLPSLVDYWSRVRSKITEGECWTKYEDFQHAQRSRHPHYFGSNLLFEHAVNEHPFRQLRGRRPRLIGVQGYEQSRPVGITEVAEALCLPLDTLQFWEKKYRLQASVPKGVKAVLNEIGYTRSEISAFEKSYQQWRMEHKGVTMT